MRMRDSTYDYMMSTARLNRITVGADVEATASAPELVFGLTGQVLRIRRPDKLQEAFGVGGTPAVLVRWKLGADERGRDVWCDHVCTPTMIKLRDGEEWDEDGDYPLAPEPDAEQMRMEV